MKLSKDEVQKEIRTLNTKPTANELAEQSLDQRLADAAKEYVKSGWPTPIRPCQTLADAIAAAHARLAVENAKRHKH